ncbi:hypothetical protein LSH36_297g03053 [Paralvinella palmiformis]|uniref:Nucleoside phosphorylase domain-containing protein n=1 Tax=Paralvinella palmiformis TaxID=53620 RepID=A0AAD9N192_9ANNE|nr:hypothetical protein LSH36_297g03053 [Paralvinella palmiformis]
MGWSVDWDMSWSLGCTIGWSMTEVVLYPLRSHDPTVKVLRVARVPEGQLDNKMVQHIAGGPYKGIIVSKATQTYPSRERPHAVREFLAHVLDTKTTKRSDKQLRERRKVFMWFKDGKWDREQIADRFFRTLIDPDQFPKDYISFVKKVIVMAKSYHMIQTIELELSPALDEYRPAASLRGYRTSWIEKPTYLNNDDTRITADSQRKRPISTPVTGFITPQGSEEETRGTYQKLATDETPEKRTITSVERTPLSNDPKVVGSDSGVACVCASSGKSQEHVEKTQKSQISTEHYINAHPESRESPRPRIHEEAQRKKPENEVVEVTIVKKTVTKAMTSPPTGVHPGIVNEVRTVEGEDRQDKEDRLTEEDRAADRLLVLTTLEDSFPNALDAHQLSRFSAIQRRQWSQIPNRNIPTLQQSGDHQLLKYADGIVYKWSVTGLSERRIKDALAECSKKELVRELDGSRWIRVSTVRRKPKSESRLSGYSRLSSGFGSKHDFQVVPQMPILPDRDQPTIAIITLLYCEKQAIDVMMENKTTYVRYKTEGEGQVYTIGSIGPHKVVSTKLTRIGKGQGATVSAGNLITRLLGTFNKVDHVFLVGVGGGIPDYDDDVHHVRCGDVVISKPQSEGSAIYISLTEVEGNLAAGDVAFGTRTWQPDGEKMACIISDLANRYSARSMINSSLSQYIDSGLAELEGQEHRFARPDPDTDQLRKLAVDGTWVEVAHPESASDSPRRLNPGKPVLFFGNIGTGYELLVKGGSDLRHEFALFNNVYTLDVGYQAVLESIEGNRKDSFWIIRGVADYVDGMTGGEWQPYASLAAAAVTKTILMKLSAVRK